MNLSESVEKIVNSESMALSGFYDRLFARYPELQDFFPKSNLSRQTAMLTMALVSVKQYPVLRGSSRAYLQAIGAKHHGRTISRELFPKFVEVLVEEVAAFHGDDWTDALDRQWTEALNLAALTMQEGYKD